MCRLTSVDLTGTEAVRHRKWRALPLPFWTPASAKTNAFWESNDVLIGSITPHSKHSFQMRITFHKRDHSGLYGGPIPFGSPTCLPGPTILAPAEINLPFQPYRPPPPPPHP